MSILFGHPAGNPNSCHAALSHWEHGRLEAFCAPWLPTEREIRVLSRTPGLRRLTARLSRRCFQPLSRAPRIEGKWGEWSRMARRITLERWMNGDLLSNEANHWLMRTMRTECHRPNVTAVHSYEDCSLWAFREAKRLGKARIYDMPIGYYPAWQETEARLLARYSEWLPQGWKRGGAGVPVQQKVEEMTLADVVLAPSTYVVQTIRAFVDKEVCMAPYGVDLDQWQPAQGERSEGPLRFLYVGHASVRKGTPMLLSAWIAAGLRDAELVLAGAWKLHEGRKDMLPPNVRYVGHCGPDALRALYQQADVFIFPSFFEGRSLVLGEAMACGLAVFASDASGAADMVDEQCGRVFPAGDFDGLVEGLRFFADHRQEIPAMGAASLAKARTLTWERYRRKVSEAVEGFC